MVQAKTERLQTPEAPSPNHSDAGMMGVRILALESACAACSVALWHPDGPPFTRSRAMERGHTEALMPMAVAVMEESESGFDTIDAVAVTIGPGSFTGIRTGIAAAQGVALACDIPLIGVTTLEAVAHAVLSGGTAGRNGKEGRPVLVALETRRADLYIQWFSPSLEPLGDAEAVSIAQIAGSLPDRPFAAAGDGIARLRDAFGDADVIYPAGSGQPDAVDVAALAAARWSEQDAAGASVGAPLRPLY